MWIIKLAIGLAAAYVLLVAAIYLVQTRLLFPTGAVGAYRGELPEGASRQAIATPDGETLVVARIPAADGGGATKPLILGFGGNAWNAEDAAMLLHRLLPGHDVAVAYYRGYAPSTGRPGAAGLLADAVTVHDSLDAPAGVIAVGFSIGSGIAARLAAERPVTGLVLVTPFDSMTALAREHYPWAPVGPLMRHQIETVADLARVEAPAAVITAERDTVIPASRSGPVRAALRNPVLAATVAGAGHNDIYDRPEFAEALREAVARIEAAGG